MKYAPPDDHVFPDGLTFGEVRAAVAAAGSVDAWDIADTIAKRYRLQHKLCLICGVWTTARTGTYLDIDTPVRVCVPCRGTRLRFR